MNHDPISPIPKIAVIGMWAMLIGILLILPAPFIGVPLMFIGGIAALSPNRP